MHFFSRTVLDFFALKLRRKRGEFEYVLVAALVFIQRNLLGIRYVLPIQLKKTQDGIEMNSSLVSFHPSKLVSEINGKSSRLSKKGHLFLVIESAQCSIEAKSKCRSFFVWSISGK